MKVGTSIWHSLPELKFAGGLQVVWLNLCAVRAVSKSASRAAVWGSSPSGQWPVVGRPPFSRDCPCSRVLIMLSACSFGTFAAPRTRPPPAAPARGC